MTKTVYNTRLSIALQATERAAVRAEVFRHWIAEEPGTSTVRNTYRYDVETLSDGSKIYLTRPTRLNKGADFVIYCENFTTWLNGNPKPPKHSDLFNELNEIVSDSEARKHEILSALHRIWECEESGSVLESLVLFRAHLRAERVLLLAKWFFIEQDVTYWTESGRHMLWEAFEDEFGPLP